MGQNRHQREKLPADCIAWKKPRILENQVVLVIDDVMTTGTTLRHCGEILQEGFPGSLYALTTCLT